MKKKYVSELILAGILWLGGSVMAASLQDEAALFVESVIQVSIYQDEDGFVARVPGGTDTPEAHMFAKQRKQEFTEDLIKEIKKTHKDTTGVDIPGGLAVAVANGMKKALKLTSYRIDHVQKIDDQSYVVYVAIRGLDRNDLVRQQKLRMQKERKEGMTKEAEIFQLAGIEADSYTNATPDNIKKQETIVPVQVFIKDGVYRMPSQDDFIPYFTGTK